MARKDHEREERIRREYRTRRWDVALEDLQLTIARYLIHLRKPSNSSEIPKSVGPAYTDVYDAVKNHLAEIFKVLDRHVPARIYARNVVEYSIRGLSNEEFAFAIFEEYFISCGTYRQIADLLDISRSSVGRRVRRFPRKIAEQLWKKNHELKMARESQSSETNRNRSTSDYEATKEQRRKRILERSFKLTARQAGVLLEYCLPGGNVGRRAIAERLYISENTLKDHISSINRRMGTASMKEAVQKAVGVLRKHPKAEWGL